VDAHGYGRRFIVRGDEMLTVFVELERQVFTVACYLVSFLDTNPAERGKGTAGNY